VNSEWLINLLLNVLNAKKFRISINTFIYQYLFSHVQVIDLTTCDQTNDWSKDPAKRSQHVNATYRNIVRRNMLRAFGRPVATYCDVLGVVGSNMAIFKLVPTISNMSQHIATRRPNAHDMLQPKMLRYVALACCDLWPGRMEL